MDWNAMAAPWLKLEAETDAAHGPVLDELMARAELQPGQSVLDIGPGAGVSLLRVAEAVGPSGHVTGIEIAPPFAARARQRVPENVTVLEADGQSHDYAPQGFDVAISLFGVMFFADSLAAFRNLHAALKPGASLHFACWGPPPLNPWFSMPARVATDVFGPGPKPDPTAPGPMRFADAVALTSLLSGAGFDVRVDPVDLHLTPAGGPADVTEMMMTIGAASARMKAEQDEGRLTDAHLADIRARLTEEFAKLEEGGGVRVPARINFVCAVA